MRRPSLLGVVFATTFLTSSLALADIAPDPCDGMREGVACMTFDDEPGTCIHNGDFLECKATSASGGGGAGGSGGSPSGSGGDGTDPPSDDAGSDDSCSLKSGGNQRGASTLAALAALALGVWISRRRAR